MECVSRRKFVGMGCVGSLAGLLYLHGLDDGRPDEEVRRGGSDAEVHRERRIRDDDVKYVGDGTVRIVEAVRGGEPIRYVTEPFEEWAQRRCREVAAAGVASRLRTAFDREHRRWQEVKCGYGEPIDPALEPGILVNYVLLMKDGKVVDRPDVKYGAIVDAAPMTASATVTFDEQMYEAAFPVWVQKIPRTNLVL